jgi:hypothetical protein
MFRDCVFLKYNVKNIKKEYVNVYEGRKERRKENEYKYIFELGFSGQEFN